jgi:pilus assembly protein Flp/PilA
MAHERVATMASPCIPLQKRHGEYRQGKEVTPMFRIFDMFDMYYTYLLARVMPHVKSERGATAVEYGLIVAGIAAVIAAVVVTLGGKVKGAFSNVSGAMP